MAWLQRGLGGQARGAVRSNPCGRGRTVHTESLRACLVTSSQVALLLPPGTALETQCTR